MAGPRLLARLLAYAGLVAIAIGCHSTIALAAETAPDASPAEAPPAPPTFEWNVFLGDWHVLGPVPKLSRDQRSTELDRQLVDDEAELRPGASVTIDGKQLEWRAWPGGMVDFIRALGVDMAAGQYSLAYAYTEFTSDADQSAILAIAHDDCAAVWLNGKEIHRKDAWVSSELDQVTVKVQLQQGTNRLLAKVSQGYGNWEFAARLRPVDVEKPLLTMNAGGSSNGNMARLPLVEVDLLDAEGKSIGQLRASGGRVGGSGVRYTLFAPLPDPEPANIRVHFDEPGFLPFDKTFNWPQAKSGNIWISLAAKDRLRGRVVDEKTGKPVAGAEFYSGESLVAKKSADDGSFEFTMKDPLADVVEVRAAGYEPLETRAEHGGEWTVKIARGGHTFRGRVLSVDGSPISGARITAYAGRRNLNFRTDADGRFEISGLPGNDNEIYPTVSHPDFVPKDGFQQPLDADGVTEVEWQLEKGCVVRGRVIDKSDGRPIAGILITSGTDRFSSNEVKPQTQTDEEGRFELGGLAAGTVLVHAFTHDFVPATLTVTTTKDAPANAHFELVKGKPISGRIVDPEGKPVPGVTLAIDTINGSRMLDRRVNTDADGEFRYENMPDTPVKIDMFKTGWVSKRDFEPKGGDHTELTLYPVVEHVARVRAADTNAPPKNLATQIGYQWQGRDEISWQDDDYSNNTEYDPTAGVLRIHVDEASSSKLFWRFRAPGYRDHVLENPEVGTPAKTFDVTLEKVATSRGKVVDADTGEPVAGVVVALVNKEDRLRLDHYVNFSESYNALEQFTGIHATTAGDGTFELSQPTSAQATDLVLFNKDQGFHYIPNAGEALAAGDVELPLPAGGTLEGRVIVAGKPVADEPVHIAWIAPGDRNNSWDLPFGFGGQVKTDAEGRFRYTGLGPGMYQVNRIRNFEYPSGRGSMSSYLSGSEVLVLPGQTLKHDFIVPAGYKVSGTVVDAESKPAANCQVEITRAELQSGRQDVVFTQADGRFEFLHLQPGSYTLRADQYVLNEWGGFNPGGGTGTGAVKVVNSDSTASLSVAPRQQWSMARAIKNAFTAPPTIVGSAPPDFSGKLFGSDKSFTLADHLGKVVAIDFWATWCGPCMAVMPETKQLYEKYKDSPDVVFVTVSLDQDVEALKTVIAEQGIEFPVVFENREASQEIAKGFGVSGIPASFVIGRDGRFASERVHGSQLAAALEAAVKAPLSPRFGAGVKPARLTVKLSLDEGASGLPGASITFKAFDDVGMPVGEETMRTPGQSKQITWLYAPFESGGKIDVKVEADGLEPQQKTVESPADKAEVTFDFQSPRVIRGKVTVAADVSSDDENSHDESSDGKAPPVPAAAMKVTAHRLDGLQRTTTTDAQGKFEIRVMPGTYYVIPVGNGDFAPILANRQQLEVTADADPEPLEISACRTVTVTGTVTDEDDQPVAGAEVRTTSSEKSVKTDAAGRFELPGVSSRGAVQLYALKRPKSAMLTLENCDGKEPQTLVLGTQTGQGATRLSKGVKLPKLPLVTLAEGEPVDWQPTADRDTLVVFAPLWHPASRDLLTRAKTWAEEHEAELLIVSTDWSLAQARRAAATYASILPTSDAVLFAGPGGFELGKNWALKGAPQAYLVSGGKIGAAPAAGALP